MNNFTPGTILAFSGHDPISWGIRIRTGRWLWPSLWSHIGIIVDIRAEDVEAARYFAGFQAKRYDYVRDNPPGICLLESTTMLEVPCLVTGKEISGVQCTDPIDRIDGYNGRVASMEPLKALDEEQRSELARLALTQCGTPYDVRGVALLGTLLWKRLRGRVAASRAKYFCSELVEHDLRAIRLTDRFTDPPKPGYADPSDVVDYHEDLTHHSPEWRS